MSEDSACICADDWLRPLPADDADSAEMREEELREAA